MYNKILVAFDGSDQAINALQCAVSLEPDHITVLCVHTIVTSCGRVPMLASRVIPDLEYIMSRDADQLRNQILKITSHAKVVIDIQFKSGNAVNEICQFAEKGHYSLIVVGSRGLTRVAEFAFGSVSHKVLQHSERPVLIVK